MHRDPPDAAAPPPRVTPQATGPGEPPVLATADELVDRHRGLVSRTLLVSGLTLASRIVGFAREMLSAALFGDRSAIFDAFITAWRVPNLFRRFLGEGALSTSLQTIVTRADGEEGAAAGRAVFLATARATAWILLVVCAVVMLAVANLPDTMPVTGWRWLGADPEPVRELTVRVMPYVVLVCLSAIGMGALNVRGHFAAPAVAPVAMNLVWVAALVVIGARWGWPGPAGAPRPAQLEMARFLAWGVLAAGVIQLLVLLPALARRRLLPARGDGARVRERAGAAGEVLRRAAPLALGAAVYQINVMVDGLMAEELLSDGGPTAHYYANRVQQFPMALIAIAATSSVFPALQALGLRRRMAEVRALHDGTQLAVVFVALPAAVGLWVLAEPLATVLFQRGAYGPDGVARIAATLRMLALAVIPAGAAGLLGRTYYALGDFRTPVRVSVATLLANIVLNALLVAGAGMDADGLALATAVSSWANVLLLAPGLSRVLDLPARRRAWLGPLARMGLAAALSGAAAAGAHAGAARLLGFAPDAAEHSVLALVLGVGAGVGAYAAAAAALRLEEWGAFLARWTARGKGTGGLPRGPGKD